MITTASRRLCVSVEPFEGESFISLISRAAQANGFERTGQIFDLAGAATLTPHYAAFSQVEDAEKIARLLSLRVDQVKSRMHPAVRRTGMPDTIDWYGTPLARKYVTARLRRFGAIAQSAGDFHAASAMIKPIKFCSVSAEIYKTHCRHGHRLGWAIAKRQSVCDVCGETLFLLDHESAEKLEAGIFNDCLKAARLVSPDIVVRNLAMAELPQPFCAWEAGDAFTAVIELGVTADELTAKAGKDLSSQLGPGRFSEYAPAHLARGYRVVSDWPRSIDEFLEKEVTDACRTSFVKSNPLGKFFARYAPKIPLRDLLRERARDGGFNFDGRRRSPIIRRVPAGNTSKMAKRFGICERTLRRLHGAGACIISTNRRTHRPVRYDSEMLAISLEQLRGGIRDDQCSRLLGVPDFCVPAMADIGLLNVVTDHDALIMARDVLYERASVQALAATLSNLPLVEREGSGISICDAMLGRFVPEDWADVMWRLVSGNIAVLHRSAAGGRLLDGLIVDRNEIEQVLVALPHRELPLGVHMSNTTTAKLLGIADGAMGHLVRAGWLRAVRSNQMEIPLIDAAAFHSAYLMAPEGAISSRVTKEVFAAKVKNCGIVPAIKLKAVTAWARTEAEQVIESFLMLEMQRVSESEIAKQWKFRVEVSETGVGRAVSSHQ